MTLPHIPGQPPLDDFLDDVESFPGETFADKLKAHAEAFLGLANIPETPENGETREFNWIDTFETPNPLRHISESEKRQKEPGMGVSVDAKVRTYTSDCPLCEWKSRKFKKQSLASMAYLQHRQEHGMGGF
jgi:hypothetical protein